MTQSFESLADAEQYARAALRALWDIQSGFLKRSAYLQYSLATIGMEGGLRQWQLWSALAERDAMLAGQQEIADSLRPRFNAVARETAETLRGWSENFTAWTLGAFQTAATAPRAARPARSKTAPRRSRKKTA